MRWFHFSKYTPETLAGIRAGGYGEREQQAQQMAESLGAELIAISWCLGGEWDLIALYERDDIDLAQWHEMSSMVASTGDWEQSVTVFAVSSEEADAAMAQNPLALVRPGES